MSHDSLTKMLGLLGSVLDVYSACLFFTTQGGKEANGGASCYLAASFSLGDRVDRFAHVTAGQGLVGWILRNQEPLLVDNFDQRQNYLGYYKDNEEQSIKAFMGYPLAQGQGVLCVDSKKQYSFAERDQKLLHLFANLIAQLRSEVAVLDRRRLTLEYFGALSIICRLRYTHSKWADFLRGYLDLLSTVAGFSYAVLFTADSHEEHFQVEGENIPLLLDSSLPPNFPLASGIAGWVFRNGKSVVNVQEPGGTEPLLVGKLPSVPAFSSIVAMPLIIHRKTRGVLCLAHESPVAIDEDTKAFIAMAAEYLSLFLENLLIKNQLKNLHQARHAE